MSQPLTRRQLIQRGGSAALLAAGGASTSYYLLKPDPKVRVVLVRGLLGWFFSGGMHTLADKLNEIPGVEATVHTFAGDSATLARKLAVAAGKGQRIVSIGHSMGGDEAVKICWDLFSVGINVDLCGPVDGTRQSMQPIPANVDECLCFYQRHGAQFGQGIATLARGNKHTKLENVNMGRIGHTAIDKAAGVHNGYINRVKALAALPPRIQKPVEG